MKFTYYITIKVTRDLIADLIWYNDVTLSDNQDYFHLSEGSQPFFPCCGDGGSDVFQQLFNTLNCRY